MSDETQVDAKGEKGMDGVNGLLFGRDGSMVVDGEGGGSASRAEEVEVGAVASAIESGLNVADGLEAPKVVIATAEESGIVEESREHVNIVFIGHVDSGKSTTSGQILFLTGYVSDRMVEKYTREAQEKKHGSWYLAFIMDALEEERAKGKTVEVGRANFETCKKRYTILDAPGHKGYVPNMIIGVTQADIAILVISARKGEFEAGFERSGQTREHILLSRSLGIRTFIVAINKMDEFNWEKSRYDEIIEKLNVHLKFYRFGPKDVIFIPISGLNGTNIRTSVSPDLCDWYKGGSLIDILDNLPPMKKNAENPLRLPVLDRYRDMGLTVLGKIEQGTVVRGHQYLAVPSNHTLEIIEIQEEDKRFDSLGAGENAQLIVKGIDDSNIHKGDIICDPSNPIPFTTEFIGMVVLNELPSEKPQILVPGSSCVIHIHMAASDVTIVRILVELDKKGQIKKKLPKFLKTPSFSQIHFKLPQAIAMDTYKACPQLGRFVLRDENTTIGFGQVLHLGPPTIVKKKNP